MIHQLGNGLCLRLGEPVVVSMAPADENRWGYHQFVNLSEYPGGRILLRFHFGEDAASAYGAPNPSFISSDNGKSWTSLREKGLPGCGLSARAFEDEFICLPPSIPLNVKALGLAMPKPVGKFYCYCWNYFYRVDQCSEPVRVYLYKLDGARWTPQTRQWNTEIVGFEPRSALVWTRAEGSESDLIPRTYFEYAPLRVGKELIYADYRSYYLNDDGSVPSNWGVTCMVSRDNGSSFGRRATVATDSAGNDALTEPMLAQNVESEMVCVIRRTDHNQKPMLITFSQDRGKTWEKPAPLHRFGVRPNILRLDCGIMVLSFGRPGVYLSFSLNGTGREWTEPLCVLPGDPDKLYEHTDGYTSLMRLSRNEALLAYTDFEYADKTGNKHKTILVRKLTVEGK